MDNLQSIIGVNFIYNGKTNPTDIVLAKFYFIYFR